MSAVIFARTGMRGPSGYPFAQQKRDHRSAEADFILKRLRMDSIKVPPPDPRLREELSALSLEELGLRLRDLNPQLAARTDLKNPRRVIRAIEIAAATAVIPSEVEGSRNVILKLSQRDPSTDARDDEFAGVLLLRDRDDLYQRINERVNAMFREGVEEEVRALPGYRSNGI